MKSVKTIMAGCVMMFALTGCFKEDTSVCPPENNVTINYVLPTVNGYDSFLDEVIAATTAIYDEEGELVAIHETNNDHHLSHKGLRLNLEPGVYRVISWGNTDSTDKTGAVHRNLEYHYKPDADAVVTYSEIIDGKVGHMADELYYGPNTVDMTRMGTGEGNESGEYILTVTEKGHYGTINFRHAYRRVEVYVKNFDDGNGGTTPDIQLTDLPAGLMFGGMKPIDGGERVYAEVSTEMVTVTEDGEENRYAQAELSSFYFHLNDHEIDVNVINPATGSTVFTTHLHDNIAPETDDPEGEMVLRILIEFLGDTEVTVTVPDWSAEDVDHGFFD
jgi:hypothetical protein